MSAMDLTAITAGHSLNPHDFGCSCGQWTYRATFFLPLGGIDIPGHLIHVAEVVEAAVREQIAAEADADAIARVLRTHAMTLITSTFVHCLCGGEHRSEISRALWCWHAQHQAEQVAALLRGQS